MIHRRGANEITFSQNQLGLVRRRGSSQDIMQTRYIFNAPSHPLRDDQAVLQLAVLDIPFRSFSDTISSIIASIALPSGPQSQSEFLPARAGTP